jgi:hypothetical protein
VTAEDGIPDVEEEADEQDNEEVAREMRITFEGFEAASDDKL